MRNAYYLAGAVDNQGLVEAAARERAEIIFWADAAIRGGSKREPTATGGGGGIADSDSIGSVL